MEVVRSNFIKLLPVLEDAIKRSVFIALDTEFTGLSVTPYDQPSFFDSINERYRKVRQTARHFTICQFGLSAFVKDSSENGYVAHSFNFYLFPKEQGKHKPRFSLQASNMEFLCEHNFDFNKWIYEGIPYCTAKEEPLVFDQSETANRSDWIEAVGFRYVFKLLVDAKKPLLGHNMLLDMAYMLEKFHRPLPANYQDFKREIHSLFPEVIDTKTVSFELRKTLEDTKMLDQTSLEEVYETVRSQRFAHKTVYTPVIRHSEKSVRYHDGQSCFHEAGFDAYCVGFVFLRLAHFMSMRGVKSTEATPVHFKHYLRVIQPYSNKINLSRGPVNYVNLIGPDPKVKERGLLVLRDINGESLDEEQIRKECGQYGRVDVQLMQSNNALLAVASPARSAQLMHHLTKNPQYVVRQYSWFRDNPPLEVTSRILKSLVLPTVGSLLVFATLYQMWKFYHL